MELCNSIMRGLSSSHAMKLRPRGQFRSVLYRTNVVHARFIGDRCRRHRIKAPKEERCAIRINHMFVFGILFGEVKSESHEQNEVKRDYVGVQ